MKHQFQFDKTTGTMRPTSDAVEQGLAANVHKEVSIRPTTSENTKPVFENPRQITTQPTSAGAQGVQVVKMKRVNEPTAIQLVNEDGLPEAYLDSDNTGVMMFREMEDYDICQITDEKTGKVLAYIGGYALQINFNMSELRTMERIEQCLQGLTKLFRHKIMTQNLAPEQNDAR